MPLMNFVRQLFQKYKRTAGQLVREFWLQAIVSLGWATYRVSQSASDLISIFVANFSVSFFLTSWLMGQVVRVRRQQRIEDEFQNVKSDLRNLLDSLGRQTQHLIGHTTGGDSIGYFEPTRWHGTMRLDFSFINVSEYPVFDVFAEWIDLDESIDIPNKFWTRHRIVLGTVHAHKATMSVFGFDMSQRSRLNINIFIQTRNRGIIQQFRVAKVDGVLKFAS